MDDGKLPETFVVGWERLWVKVFPVLGGERGRDPDAQTVSVRSGAVVRTSSGERDARGAARGTAGKRAGASTREVIGSERALVLKARLERKLRRMAREIFDELDGVGGDGRRASLRACVRCGRFGEEGWAYCPADGATMQETS